MARTALALHRLSQLLQHELGRTGDLDVTPAEVLVLAILRDRGPTSVGELVDLLGHRPSTLTTILDRLSDRRLVVRQVRPDDRRSFLVLLTERGQDEALRSERALAEAEAAMLDSLDRDTASALRSALGT
ncbi:MAG: MarR family transcriptional regulator [Actinobacteria bacterium]|nr:MarR family transcriptional regulator [Actinomycetota bacterium]